MKSNYFNIPELLRDFPNAIVEYSACGISLDISRQRISPDDLRYLFKKACSCGMYEAHARMMAGELVNPSEHRAALHTSLRAFSSSAPKYEEVYAERLRLFKFARSLRTGEWKGYRGDYIKNVINIGIGGSAAGPQCVWNALRPDHPKIKLHFLSSVDRVLLSRILAQCEAKSTLVIVSSKSFKTQETLINAKTVDKWLNENGIIRSERSKHIVVISANPEAAKYLNLPSANQFHLWDWVGGRFSVWGATGLPDLIGLGEEAFLEFLQGANEMDLHSTLASENNLPALLALIEYWNTTTLGVSSLCVLPYDERLRAFVPWLQQLEMESLGKSRTLDSQNTICQSGLAVWGGNGNEAQHSFGQWLREGTSNTAIDLILPVRSDRKFDTQYRNLFNNAIAQCEALIFRPNLSNFFNVLTKISLDDLSPRRLGALMALYEHKTTMLGWLFNINPFDQPGVEYGKQLSLLAENNKFLK